MKKRFKVGIAIVLLLATVFSQAIFAASGLAKVYYNTNLSIGTTTNIRSILSNMGYTATQAVNPSPTVVLNAFGDSKVVHVLSHGAPGTIAMVNGSVTANQIRNKYSSLSTQFVFLEGCQMASSSSSNGDLDDTLYGLGVKCTLAFRNNVSASTDSDGVHYFAHLLYQDINSNNWSVSTSAATAMSTLYNRYGNYYGVDSMVIRNS